MVLIRRKGIPVNLKEDFPKRRNLILVVTENSQSVKTGMLPVVKTENSENLPENLPEKINRIFIARKISGTVKKDLRKEEMEKISRSPENLASSRIILHGRKNTANRLQKMFSEVMTGVAEPLRIQRMKNHGEIPEIFYANRRIEVRV
ncbi:hypothetical protein SDC9_52450 [bioreactor metagenome]|uniref:Uncharacterized protein n=1 Tax=bioreactor metagenome TaxID=1076179 RepID=A0A644WVS0_9ZZZZ